MKSNPNLLTMDRISTPETRLEGVEPAEGPVSRPEVPAVVQEVIETQTDARPAEAAADRGFWDRIMGFLGKKH